MTEYRKISELPVAESLSDTDKFIVETLTGTKAVTRDKLKEETQITPEDIGLGNVDNTHDLDKPISNAMASALLDKVDISTFNTTLQDFLTKIDAAATYLTQNNASGTYLSKTDAIANYETKLDHSTDMATKQDVINDLATIRAGATAGGTAVQPEDLASVATSGDYEDLINNPTKLSDFIDDLGTNPVHTHSQYLTSTALENYQQKITSSNKLNADLIEDGTINKAVTANDKTNWNAKLDSSAIADMATQTWVSNQGFLTQHQDISGKANISDLSEVAFSGDYDDLVNKPVIPLNLSQFTDDLGSAPIHTHNQYLTTGTYTVLTTTTQTVLGAINEINGLLDGVEELLSEV